MPDLAARLVDALDRTEQEAHAGVSDLPPGVALRLTARDRAVLNRHTRVEPDHPERMVDELIGGWCSRCMPDDTCDGLIYEPWPCPDVRDAAAFWLPEVAR